MSKKNTIRSTITQAVVSPPQSKNKIPNTFVKGEPLEQISKANDINLTPNPSIVSIPPTYTNVTLLSISSITDSTVSILTSNSEVTKTNLTLIEAKKAAAEAAIKAEIAIKKADDFFKEAIKNANEAAVVAKAKLLAIQKERLSQQLQKSSPPMLPDDVQEASH